MRLAQTVALAAVLTLFGTAPSAFADANSAATGADEPLPYCNLNLATMVETCAPTEVELLAQTRSSRAAAATYILAYMYDSAGNTGLYYTITNTAPCDTNSDVDFSVTNIGTTWNDRISSWTGFAECELRIYENATFGGASYGTYTSSSYVGDAMNDRTTSIRLS
jgi:hypothetical protein